MAARHKNADHGGIQQEAQRKAREIRRPEITLEGLVRIMGPVEIIEVRRLSPEEVAPVASARAEVAR